MKTLRLAAFTIIVVSFLSCTKTKVETVTKTVTVTDTVHTVTTNTVVVNDTIHVVAMGLVGQWTLYNMTDLSGNNPSNPNMIMTFTPTQLTEAGSGVGANGTYPVTYGTNYVQIQYSLSNIILYNITTSGNEYVLTSLVNGLVWHLKK